LAKRRHRLINQGGGSGGGAVASVFGRTGAVLALQSDYDSFFLTQAEGDALYAEIVHTHAGLDLNSGDCITWNDSFSSPVDLLCFEPSVVVTDPDFASVVFLTSLDGSDGATTALDKSNNAHVMTFIDNAQLSTTLPKFGSASAVFDGAGDWIQLPDDPSFGFGPNPFTIECFVKFNGDPKGLGFNQIMLSKWDSLLNNQGWVFWFSDTSGDTLNFNWSTNGSNNFGVSGAWSPAGDTWYHVAVVTTLTNIMLYIDGVQVLNSVTSVSFSNPPVDFRIGNIGTLAAPAPLLGNIDEVRITSLARYTAAFTPPSEPFPVATTVGPEIFTSGNSGFGTIIEGSLVQANNITTGAGLERVLTVSDALTAQTYSTGTFSTDRALSNSATATLQEVADVLSTLIEDLRSTEILD